MQAELRALRAQIHPHFLFNALNTIAALIHTRPAEAEAVVEELAGLFRYMLHASQRSMVSLDTEIDCIKQYLAVEQARFQDRLEVYLEIPEMLRKARVPSLFLQPLVENAVKHGVNNIEGTCTIKVEAHKHKRHIQIRVCDTGPGFDTTDTDLIFKRGHGLVNVRDRLHLLFGTQATVTLLHNGVELKFPYQIMDDNIPGRPTPSIDLPVSPVDTAV